MTSNGKGVYGLYIAEGEHGTNREGCYAYYNSCFDYTLIFASKDKSPADFREVPQEAYSAMTDGERQWLMACKLDVNTKAMNGEQKENYYSIFELMLERFEAELEKQRIKQTEVANGNS